MAAKLENSNLRKKSLSLPLLVTATIAVVFVFSYVWSKICQVVRESYMDTEDGWWIMKKFSTDKSPGPGVSFTEKQFYLALLGAILNDLSLVLASFKSPVVLVLLSTVILASIFVYAFYTKNQAHDKKKPADKKTNPADAPIKKESYQGNVRSQPNRGNDGRGVAAQKKVPSWKGFGWGYRHYWRLILGIMFLAFLMSIPWEFVRLYQTMVAEKVTHITSVITSALSHCLVYPVEIFFDRLGRSFRLFFSEIPAQWQPFIFLVSMVFIALFLIMLFGYRIRCPLLAIEPKKSLSSYLSRSTKKKLVEDLMANGPDSSIDSCLDYSITSTQATEIYSSLESDRR